jgi:pyruvate,water dikinase
MTTTGGDGFTVWFSDPGSTDLSLVGGKGANLGRLAQSGFVVPPGFVIGTHAYTAHIASIKTRIADVLANVNYGDPTALDESVCRIRRFITDVGVPAAVADDIRAAYARLGDRLFVAVRSSGTAEDLEGASFAGLHDTYLDIKGDDNLIDAVKRCWASLWTARAVSYRKTRGFTQFPSIAVVVQTMVESEVSGVLFTGNPINAATDQLVINASWGLGEAIVSGIVTPDEYIVRHAGLKVINRTLGSKRVKVVRDPAKSSGTVTQNVAEAKSQMFTLSDEQVSRLAEIGVRIQSAYDGFPQDIEWAYSESKFYILQARPITSVDFSWDAEVTNSVQGNDDGVPYDNVWSRVFPEEMWTGAISPLMFSWRCWGLNQCHSVGVHAFGYPEMDYTTHRLWTYYKGVSYYNSKADLQLIKTAVPPQLRAGMLHKIPKEWHEEALKAGFDWDRYIESFLRVEKHRPDMGYNWWRANRDDFIESEEYRANTRPRSIEELRSMSDADLKQHIATVMRLEIASYDPPWNGLLYYMREALGWIGWIAANWYKGGRGGTVFMDLMTGTRNPTVTSEDNHAVWELAELIHRSPELSSLFSKYPDARFLNFVEQCVDGPAFKQKYDQHVRRRGHRGHPDRDIYFDRRADDPMVDFRVFGALMGTPDPRVQEHKMRERLEDTIRHVYDDLRGQELGVFKAKLFRFLIDFAHNSLEYRDNEREVMDWSTYAIKLGFEEVGRRCLEKGLLRAKKEEYFLTMEELYDVWAGTANQRLTRAKIAARSRNFDRINVKSAHPSAYLQFGRPASIDQPVVSGDGVLCGKITSVGKITGTARVVHELSQIGRVQPGEILIVHATDPGWTPVFMIIKGIVLETGGLISHGALLAREYGLPGVQIEGALQLIPDGAKITLDGDAGRVIVHPETDAPTELGRAA